MEKRNLYSFLKVVEYNNITKAAESLGYSQAAVTMQIKQLEKELGVPLFDRMGKRIRLTSEGERFLPHAMNIIQAEEEAIASMRPQGELTGELWIGASSSLAMGVLPDIVLEFTRRHPKVNISVKVNDYLSDLFDKVDRGELDFMVFLEEKTSYSKYNVIAEREERILYITYPDNPMCSEGVIPIERLSDGPLILSDRDVSYCAGLDRALLKQGSRLQAPLEIGSVGGVINIIKKGYGIGYIPEYFARPYLERGEVAELTVESPAPPIYAYFVCSKERWINPVMQEFIRLVNEIKPPAKLLSVF